jgi:hypothetical protein
MDSWNGLFERAKHVETSVEAIGERLSAHRDDG